MTHGGLSPATRAAYEAVWALFRDWCTAADTTAFPATCETVQAFLAEMPAAPATQARRIAALDWAHRRAGLAAPSTDPAGRVGLRRLAGKPPAEELVQPTRDAVERAYRALPTHGWPAGLFGRRDRCLLTLTAVAAVPIERVRVLPAWTIDADSDGVLRIVTGGPEVHLTPTQDPTVCPSCACLGWVRALAIADDEPSHRVLRDALHRARPLTPLSGHICQTSPARRRPKPRGPLLVSIDRHGYPRLDRPMSARRLDGIARDLLGGSPRLHRTVPTIPGRFTEELDPSPPVPVVAAPLDPATAAERHAAAMGRRRRDRVELADLDRRLEDVDKGAADLARDLDQLLEQWRGGGPGAAPAHRGRRSHSF